MCADKAPYEFSFEKNRGALIFSIAHRTQRNDFAYRANSHSLKKKRISRAAYNFHTSESKIKEKNIARAHTRELLMKISIFGKKFEEIEIEKYRA